MRALKKIFKLYLNKAIFTESSATAVTVSYRLTLSASQTRQGRPH